MCQQETRSNQTRPDGSFGRAHPEWAARATTARASEWASDRVPDPGDSHDKGEPSLCVGEAA